MPLITFFEDPINYPARACGSKGYVIGIVYSYSGRLTFSNTCGKCKFIE